jgi:microtubule-associated protein, RP/EB family
MQDNLEFLQWTKRYWDQYFPGHDYDAVGRRKGSGAPAAPAATPRTSTGTAARRPQASAGAPPRAAPRVAAAASVGGAGSANTLRAENDTLKEAIAGLEKERDFYFSKLRDIELLIQGAIDADPELEKDDGGLVKNIQAILYSTEEGFEIPAEAEGGEGFAENGDEQETF